MIIRAKTAEDKLGLLIAAAASAMAMAAEQSTGILWLFSLKVHQVNRERMAGLTNE